MCLALLEGVSIQYSFTPLDEEDEDMLSYYKLAVPLIFFIFLTTKIPRRPLLCLLSTAFGGTAAVESRDQKLNLLCLLSTAFGGTAAVESRDQKLNWIADDLLALTKAECEDYSTLFTSRRTETRARASSEELLDVFLTIFALIFASPKLFDRLGEWLVDRKKIPYDWRKRLSAVRSKIAPAFSSLPKDIDPLLQTLDPEDLPGFTRSVYKRDHAVITPESQVFNPLPDWDNTLGAYLVSPAMGSHFTMYLAQG
ncbi:uncharacterized protein A4U43_C06F16260 [Asparagus officinalis]|uniref:Uncharacterized protein n=1 Tax=Asparagus officinalis TaxID=4686 RepID=A0A5P1ESV8_ASPOF|nr:uncharacterized protein A4U43_C06F16260 [Asparagus officinalis]